METVKTNAPTVKLAVITQANLATSEGNQGNFVGYTSAGSQYFLSKNKLGALNITTNEELQAIMAKGPLFALVTTTTHNEVVKEKDIENQLKHPITNVAYTLEDVNKKVAKVDKDGNAVTFTRETATAIFTEMEGAIKAKRAESVLLAKIEDMDRADAVARARDIEKAKIDAKLEIRAYRDEKGLTPETMAELASISLDLS